MVSQYDVFYVIAIKGRVKPIDIVITLQKPKKEYQNIFNNIIELEKIGYVKRDAYIEIVNNERSKKLFQLISFCIRNSINYNLLFKATMLNFIKEASQKEFFTIKDIKIHPKTFQFYTTLLSKYGFLLITSRKPLKCKLLRHHFLIDLLVFFNRKITFYNPKHHSFIRELKKELQKYRRNIKIHYTVLQNIEHKEEINFIYTSLHLEGNPLTLPETQKLIEKDIIPENHKLFHVQEVINYKKSIDLMIENAKNKVLLDLDLILQYHSIAMNHIHGAGELRKQNVRIQFNPEFKTSDWHLILVKLNALLKQYSEFKAKKSDINKIIEFASFFHNEFQRIHPFIDGNSRISRLLLLHIIRSYDIPALDLPLGYFDLYLDLTKRSAKRDDKSFQYLIEEIILMNLKKINSNTT